MKLRSRVDRSKACQVFNHLSASNIFFETMLTRMRSFAQITQPRPMGHSQPMGSFLMKNEQLNTFARLFHWLGEEHARKSPTTATYIHAQKLPREIPEVNRRQDSAYLLTFFLTYLLTFFLTNLLTVFSDISSDTASDISFDILSDISSDSLFRHIF